MNTRHCQNAEYPNINNVRIELDGTFLLGKYVQELFKSEERQNVDLQESLLEIENHEQKYLDLINKEYSFQDAVKTLDKIDWDFKNFTTQYLTHTFHPYL